MKNDNLKESVLTKEELIQKAKDYLIELESLPNNVLFVEYHSNSEYNEEYFSKPTFPQFRKFQPYGENIKFNGKLIFANKI